MSDRDSVVTVDELDDSDDRGHERGKESRRDGFEGGRDRSEDRRGDRPQFGSDRRDDRGSQFGYQDLASKILQIQSKRFYIDVKENRRGRFIKLSEVGVMGGKSRLVMDMATAAEFHDKLTEFSEHYSALGPKTHREGEGDGKLKSEVIYSGDRRYYMDLKENNRGRFLKVAMTLPPPSHDRSQIVIPAQGMIDIRDAFTDLLNEFGKENKPEEGGATATVGSEIEKKPDEGKFSLQIDNKSFYFDVQDNRRGKYLRISEISPNYRTAINIPFQSWDQFKELLRSSTVKRETAGAGDNVPSNGGASAPMEGSS